MLLRHKRNGNIYAYAKVLMDSGDYEIFEEPKPIKAQPKLAKVVRRTRESTSKIGEPHGTDTQ